MHKIDRRVFLGQSILASLAGAVNSWSSPAGAQARPGRAGRPFTSASQGGQYQKGFEAAFVTPVLQKHGLELRSDSFDYAKLQIQVQSGRVEWDFADVGEWFGYWGMTRNLFEPIDYKVVDRSLIPAGGALSHVVQNAVLGRVMAYNTKVYSTRYPRTWEEFWDVKAFPGKRGFWSSPHSGILEAALMADGVPPGKLFPLDLDRAFKSLDRIKAHVIPAKSGSALFQLFVDEQIDLSLALEGRLSDAIDAGAPWTQQWQWSMYQKEWIVIPKGSPYRDVAMEVIAHAVTPAAQAKYTELTGYGPSSPAAFKLLGRKYLDRFVYSPARDLQKVVQQDGAWYAANVDQVNQRWQQWLAA
jgi:putative spermidine/putrescine transport system substrate-binding protein